MMQFLAYFNSTTNPVGPSPCPQSQTHYKSTGKSNRYTRAEVQTFGMNFQQFIIGIRDWLPSISIVGGALWLVVTKLQERKDQTSKSLPAISATLGCQWLPMGPDTLLIHLSMRFVNHSPYYIHWSATDSKIEVFQVPENLSAGYFCSGNGIGECIIDKMPFETTNRFSEPSGISVACANMVLQRGNLYHIRWTLTQKDVTRCWARHLLLDARTEAVAIVGANGLGPTETSSL